MCERHNSADTKASKEGGGGAAPGVGAEIPLQPVVKTMERQLWPCSPWSGACGACQCRWKSKGSFDPHGKPVMQQTPGRKRGAGPGAGLLSGLVTLRLPTLEQPVPKGLHTVAWTHTGAQEDLQSMGRAHVGEFCGELPSMGWTSLWSTGRV